MSETPTLETRFWRKVVKGDGCWAWTGAHDAYGRGQIFANGRDHKAPRIAWEIANGKPFPPELEACHSCDNPNCVNPAHIWLGTHRENMRDARAKGRLLSPSELGVPPHNAQRTHCRRGHAFTEENTRKKNGIHRECIACRLLHGVARRAAARAARLAASAASAASAAPKAISESRPLDPTETA